MRSGQGRPALVSAHQLNAGACTGGRLCRLRPCLLLPACCSGASENAPGLLCLNSAADSACWVLCAFRVLWRLGTVVRKAGEKGKAAASGLGVVGWIRSHAFSEGGQCPQAGG